MIQISKERLGKITESALDWISKHLNSEDLLHVLKNRLEMTEEEMDFFGFDFSDLESDEDNRYSIIYFHDRDDDCCVLTNSPYDLNQAVAMYNSNIRDDVFTLSLDSIACRFGDTVIHKTIQDTEIDNDLVASVISFDLEKGELRYKTNSGNEKTYCLEDLTNEYESDEEPTMRM